MTVERKLVKKFKNELIVQMVRYQNYCDNNDIRKLILGRALYSAYIDTDNEDDINEEYNKQNLCTNYSVDDIAVDWFEVN